MSYIVGNPLSAEMMISNYYKHFYVKSSFSLLWYNSVLFKYTISCLLLNTIIIKFNLILLDMVIGCLS